MSKVIRNSRAVSPHVSVNHVGTALLTAVVAIGCTDCGSGSSSGSTSSCSNVGSQCRDANDSPVDQANETAPEASFIVHEAFTCISDWPTQEPVVPAPSLGLPRLTLVGVDKYPGSPNRENAVFSAGRIASSLGSRLASYDVSARTFANQWISCIGLSEPAIRRDSPGAFVAGCTGVLGFFPDFKKPPDSSFGPEDGVEWIHPLLPPKYGYSETTIVAPMLVDPDGILYFTATDSSFKAIRPTDGEAVWTQGLAMEYDSTSPAGRLGIADRLFFGGFMAFKRSTGDRLATLEVKGKPVSIQAAAYSRRLIGEARVDFYSPADLVVLDECGNLKWARGQEMSYTVLVGFGDSLLVREYTHPNTLKYYRISIDGTVMAGPADYGDFVFPLALGADDVLYLSRCVPCDAPCDHNHSLEIIAVSDSLAVLDRIDVGPYCDQASAVLLDDGLMVVTRVGKGHAEFVRIQTASPGLARTAWPTIRRDNERTGWVAPW